jgi:hypothetical protein
MLRAGCQADESSERVVGLYGHHIRPGEAEEVLAMNDEEVRRVRA